MQNLQQCNLQRMPLRPPRTQTAGLSRLNMGSIGTQVLCLCSCMPMYAHVHACMHSCMQARNSRVCECMRMCMHVGACACMHACMHVSVYACVCASPTTMSLTTRTHAGPNANAPGHDPFPIMQDLKTGLTILMDGSVYKVRERERNIQCMLTPFTVLYNACSPPLRTKEERLI